MKPSGSPARLVIALSVAVLAMTAEGHGSAGVLASHKNLRTADVAIRDV